MCDDYSSEVLGSVNLEIAKHQERLKAAATSSFLNATPANEKLCREIAEAEGWDTQGHVNAALGQHWFRPDGEFHYTDDDVPDWYLTDPAETVRMLEALVDAGNCWTSIAYPCIPHEDYYQIRKNYRTEADTISEGETLKEAVAQAYLAMLKEKKNEY